MLASNDDTLVGEINPVPPVILNSYPAYASASSENVNPLVRVRETAFVVEEYNTIVNKPLGKFYDIAMDITNKRNSGKEFDQVNFMTKTGSEIHFRK